MSESDEADNNDQPGENGACPGPPEDDKGEEHDESGLNVVVKRNTHKSDRLRIEKVEVEVGHNDEEPSQKRER